MALFGSYKQRCCYAVHRDPVLSLINRTAQVLLWAHGFLDMRVSQNTQEFFLTGIMKEDLKQCSTSSEPEFFLS